MKKSLEASYTVEAAFILPLVFALLYGIIFLGFYLHDHVAFEQLAWETAFYGAGQTQRPSEAEIDEYLRERLEGQLLISDVRDIEIALQKEEVEIGLSGDAAVLGFARSLIGYGQESRLRAKHAVSYPCAADYVRKGLFLKEQLGGLMDRGSE